MAGTLTQTIAAGNQTTAAISDVLTTAFNGTAATPGLVTAISEGTKAIASAVADPTTKFFLTTVIAYGAGKLDELLKASATQCETQEKYNADMLKVTQDLAKHLEQQSITIQRMLDGLPFSFETMNWYLDKLNGLEYHCRGRGSLKQINDFCQLVRDDPQFDERWSMLAQAGLERRLRDLFRPFEKADDDERTQRLKELVRLRHHFHRHVSLAE
jgi:hypothetical protein